MVRHPRIINTILGIHLACLPVINGIAENVNAMIDIIKPAKEAPSLIAPLILIILL